jgi:hypothetical protein
MIPSQYNVIGVNTVNGKKVPIFSAWPNELSGSWLQITEVSLHQTKWVCQFYFNDNYPEGTVLVSTFISKDYPDIYLLIDHDGTIDRVYINPIYRKRGLLGSTCILRTIMYDIFNIIIDTTTDSSLKTQKGIIAGYASGLEKIPERNPEEFLSDISLEDILPPRDPVYPFVWVNERPGGKIES